MRLLARELPEIPLVAAFETGFHETIPPAERLYAVPLEWARSTASSAGASTGPAIATSPSGRPQLLGKPDAKIISCHLGGSSSLCAITDGQVGGQQHGHESAERVAAQQPRRRLRSVRPAGAHAGHRQDAGAGARRPGQSLRPARAERRQQRSARHRGRRPAKASRGPQLALDVFVGSVRHYLGAYLLLLGGADAIVFTGGIGENSAAMRAAICADLDWFGIRLDPDAQRRAPRARCRIHAADSRVQLWIMPTNEELIVARQAQGAAANGAS